MRALACTALLCTVGITLFAQSGAKKEPPPGVVRSVTISGNHRYSSTDIIKESGLTVGEQVTAAVLEDARQRLQDTELFNSVADRYRFTTGPKAQYDVTLEVVENTQVFPMRFERLPKPADVIQSCIKGKVALYSEEIPATDGVLRRYRKAVTACVADKDPDVKVHAVVSNDDPAQLAVVFMPDTPPPVISQVTVSGNTVVDTGSILRAVNTMAIGTPLSDERVKAVLDGSIKPLYAEKGYPVVTFPKIDAEPTKTNKGVILHVQIKEGPPFKFGGIRFRGTQMDENEVKANIPFRPGQSYNGKQIDEFRQWLIHNLRRKGYLEASVGSDTQEDDVRRVMNVLYNVTPGPVYDFDKLDIVGLDITTSPAVEKLWGEKPGKPFNPDYPDFFLKRLQEQGLFDNLAGATSDYSADAAAHTVVVHLHFKGGKSPEEQDNEKKREKEREQDTGNGPGPL